MSKFSRTRFAVQEPTYWIGRDNAMMLTIPEKPISSTHACINWDQGQYYLIDYSTNGTWLNGHRLERETPYPLAPDQTHQIRLATECALLTFHYTTQPQQQTPPVDLDPEPPSRVATRDDDVPRSQPPADNPLLNFDQQTADVPTAESQSPSLPSENAMLPQGVKPELSVVEEDGLVVNRSVPVAKANITIGRNSERDCVVRSLHVSRLHATLFWQDNKFFVMDNGSQNGVYVDNEAISPNTPYPLQQMHLYTIHLSRHTSEPTSLSFWYEDKRTAIIDFGDFDG